MEDKEKKKGTMDKKEDNENDWVFIAISIISIVISVIAIMVQIMRIALMLT